LPVQLGVGRGVLQGGDALGPTGLGRHGSPGIQQMARAWRNVSATLWGNRTPPSGIPTCRRRAEGPGAAATPPGLESRPVGCVVATPQRDWPRRGVGPRLESSLMQTGGLQQGGTGRSQYRPSGRRGPRGAGWDMSACPPLDVDPEWG